MRSGNNQLKLVLDRWHGAGTSNSIPRASEDDPNSNNRYSDRWIEKGDFLRIKNLQLGYTLPASGLSKFTQRIHLRIKIIHSCKQPGNIYQI